MSAPSRPRTLDFGPVLQGLQAEPGVQHALLASPDGLLVCGAAGEKEANELWAAVSAVLGNLGGRLTARLGGGELVSAVFRAANSQFVVRRVTLGFVLAVAHVEAEVERLRAQVEAVAREVEEIGRSLYPERGAASLSNANASTSPERDEHV